MKIAIIGAGNVGTAMAALLTETEAEITVVARGQRLQQIGRDGVRLNDRGTLHAAHVQTEGALHSPVDAVFFCVKAQDLPSAVAANAAGIGPQTLVIPMVNGLPFWFDPASPDLAAVVDPDGTLARVLAPSQVLGAVLLMTVEMGADGLARSSNTPTLTLGAAEQGADPVAIAALADVLTEAGIRTSIVDDIRQSVMVKLLANAATNPISALVGCHLATIGQDPQLRDLSFQVANEMRQWGAEMGHDLPSNQWLGDLLLDAGDFPTSMLQDVRAGRRLELGAICHAPMALARRFGLSMPCLSNIVTRLEQAARLPLPEPQSCETLSALRSEFLPERI